MAVNRGDVRERLNVMVPMRLWGVLACHERIHQLRYMEKESQGLITRITWRMAVKQCLFVCALCPVHWWTVWLNDERQLLCCFVQCCMHIISESWDWRHYTWSRCKFTMSLWWEPWQSCLPLSGMVAWRADMCSLNVIMCISPRTTCCY